MDFVIVANAWGAGLDNPTSKHQIALELARQGHRVLWVEGAGMRSPSLGSGADRGRIVRKLTAALRGARRMAIDRVWVLTPLLIPIPSKASIRRLNSWIYCLSARLWCLLLGLRKPILINYVPVLSEVERLWRRSSDSAKAKSDKPASDLRHQASVVYHCVDRWDSFGTYNAEMMRRVDEECCRYADLVVASASDLYERCKTYNENTHLVRHGVNYEHFAQAVGIRDRRSEVGGRSRPKDMPEGLIVGFFGLLSEWVDQELLVALACELRRSEVRSQISGGSAPFDAASIVLIGKADVDVSLLKEEPNIHLLGPKPFADLPDFAAWCDVGIIPFVVNELTSAVNPIKLREMIAAGCPVVSTPMREVEVCVKQIDDGVTGSRSPAVMGRDHDEFITHVTSILSSPPEIAERHRISSAVAGETWSGKVSEILRLL